MQCRFFLLYIRMYAKVYGVAHDLKVWYNIIGFL